MSSVEETESEDHKKMIDNNDEDNSSDNDGEENNESESDDNEEQDMSEINRLKEEVSFGFFINSVIFLLICCYFSYQSILMIIQNTSNLLKNSRIRVNWN